MMVFAVKKGEDPVSKFIYQRKRLLLKICVLTQKALACDFAFAYNVKSFAIVHLVFFPFFFAFVTISGQNGTHFLCNFDHSLF